MPKPRSAEHRRLADSESRKTDWKNWGPYLAERAWGTVREDYSEGGTAWEAFSHEQSRSRAYRWNEDGLGGFCNRYQNLCLGVGLWNGKDSILKERLFGLTGNEGNHGEDVKECYYYLDGTPTHSYMKMLYKYPQSAFPYAHLAEENRKRGREAPEFELTDALAEDFAQGRYFDVEIEYAKVSEEDLLCRITAHNRGPNPAPLHILPQLWYRNTWTWFPARPKMRLERKGWDGFAAARSSDPYMGERWWVADAGDDRTAELIFTENDTNTRRLYGDEHGAPYTKDAFHDYVVQGNPHAVNPGKVGSKVAAHLQRVVAPGDSFTVRVRFSEKAHKAPFANFEKTFAKRIKEADAFYAALPNPELSDDERAVQRQSLAGLLWSKQYFHYGVKAWLEGDPAMPVPPKKRAEEGRNKDWTHFYAMDVLSMPDKWEYPWFAAWDLAFHALPIAMVDPEWAKRQLILLLREWYMHPNGQIPAYEWAFGDVNPPVHAWACRRVYQMDAKQTGKPDTDFLERVFHKLLLNFTWWVNRKDEDGRNVFQGGFLGLDNIAVFDRSQPLPTGGHMEQADGTAWMGMYCLNMLAMALELAMTKPAYEDVATKFFEHFMYISEAINRSYENRGLWDEEDGFYYDIIHTPDHKVLPLKVRSFVGLIPLFAVETLDGTVLAKLPRFRARMEWFVRHRPEIVSGIASLTDTGEEGRVLLSLINRNKLLRIMRHMLDESSFLSDYGLRSLSRKYADKPFVFTVNGKDFTLDYEPGESRTTLFGGNSNWRGPVWFPTNYLMIESLQKFHYYFGDGLKVDCPTGSGKKMHLGQVAAELSQRLTNLFLRNEQGQRPVLGGSSLLQRDPLWQDHVPFYEYFHGDTGAGLGASHQTGWTALVAKLIQQSGGRTQEHLRVAADK